MRHTSFAMLMAAFLFAGSVTAAHAAEPVDPMDGPEIAAHVGEVDDSVPPRARFGPRGRWNRDNHPGCGRCDMDSHPGHDRRDGDNHPGRWGRDGRPGPRHPRFHHNGPGFGMHGMVWDRLDLTEQQRTDMIGVMTRMFKTRLELRMEMDDLQKAARAIRQNDTATQEEIIAAHAALGTAKGKMEALHHQLRQEMRSILTEEQLKKLDDRRDAPPRFGKSGPGRPGDRPGPGGRRLPQPSQPR